MSEAHLDRPNVGSTRRSASPSPGPRFELRMMRRFALALSLILALAVPASAATRYVAQTARGTGSGADSSNAQALSSFNSAAVAGDVALMLGNFTTIPNPTRSGTIGAPIIYRSASGRTNDVCVTGAFSITGSACDSNVVWRDITIRGNVIFGGASETARWQMYNVRVIDGLFRMSNARDCRIEGFKCTVITPRADIVDMGGDYSATDSTRACRRDTIRASSFALLNAEGTGSLACTRWAGYDCLFEAVRCTVTTTTASSTRLRFVRINYTNRNVMKDCFFLGTNNQTGGGIDEPMTFAFKDGVKIFKMVRDTVIIRGTNSSASPWISFAQNETDGNPSFLGEEIGGNSIRNCYFRNETASTWPICWTYQGFDGDSIVGNTFVARNGAIESYYGRGDVVMATNSVVDHNCFVSFAHGSNAFSMMNGVANQAVTFTNNIFYNPASTNADTASVRAFNLGRTTDWGSSGVGPVGDNWNVSWTPGVTTKRGVRWSSGSSAFGMAPLTSLRSPALLDGNSISGPIQFVDSTLANFDAHPLPGSAALFGPDGYVGPFEPTGTVDAIAPGAINDLAVTGTSYTMVALAWTAPGDDGSSGTASAYDLRWSTSPITEANFGNASQVYTTPPPGLAGTPQSTIVSGLTNGTTYYFAIKARDEAGNWSAFTPAVSAGTPALDVIRPGPINDLVAP